MRLRLAAACAFSVVLFTAATQTALAAPPPNANPPEATVQTQPDATTTCTFYASKPNHSASKITGTGGIKTCSGAPAACTSETDVEFYNEFARTWMTAGANARRRCVLRPRRRSARARPVIRTWAGVPLCSAPW